MSMPITRYLPQLRHRWLTVIVAAAVLLVAASLGSAVTAPSASAQIWGWPYNSGYGNGYGWPGFGSGYGYGGWPSYGYGMGYPGSGFFLGNNTFYLNPSYGSCTNSVYCGSQFSYGGYGSSYGGYSSYGTPYSSYSGYSSYPYSSYSPLYSGSSYLGNSLYSYQPAYASSYAPSTTVTVSAQPYSATYYSGGGNYCNLPNGGMAWVPAGASPGAYGC
jgi:hypothetical protein